MTRGHDLDQLLREARIRASLPPPPVCRDMRERAGLSQWDVARVLGVSNAVISRWERQHRPPGPAVTLKYVLLLQRLAAELSSWPDKKEVEPT